MKYNLCGKSILVTGGTGQIGSFLVEALLKEKAHITVLGRNARLLKEIEPLVNDKKVDFIECNLMDQQSVELASSSLRDIQYLVHLFSDSSPNSTNIFEDANSSTETNLKVIPRILQHLKCLEGICYSSSVAVYGIPAYLPLDEQCTMNPITFYGCGKFGAEKYLKLYSTAESIPLTILRYALVYGPRNRSKMAVSLFITKALRNEPITLRDHGRSFRDFIYVSDVIDATVTAIKKNESDDYNIGSGVKCTTLDLAETIIKATNSNSQIILSDMPKDFDSVTDISKAKQKLGFAPKITLKEGLMREVEWHLKTGVT